MPKKKYYVYILSNQRNTTIYTGITSRLFERIALEHRGKKYPHSFTAHYNVEKLVHVEEYDDPLSAISREKQIKSWSRKKKNDLIEKTNPGWEDIAVQ